MFESQIPWIHCILCHWLNQLYSAISFSFSSTDPAFVQSRSFGSSWNERNMKLWKEGSKWWPPRWVVSTRDCTLQAPGWAIWSTHALSLDGEASAWRPSPGWDTWSTPSTPTSLPESELLRLGWGSWIGIFKIPQEILMCSQVQKLLLKNRGIRLLSHWICDTVNKN